jgi:hypothetical protein
MKIDTKPDYIPLHAVVITTGCFGLVSDTKSELVAAPAAIETNLSSPTR